MPAKRQNRYELTNADWDKIDRKVLRTAQTISRAIDNMIVGLPEGAAPQMAFEMLIREMVPLQQWLMQLMMEDADFREAYSAAVAELPVTAKPRTSSRP
jgi:hypothetical protein